MHDIDDGTTRDALERLTRANQAVAAAYPGERADRQPVHTVYGGAHLFTSGTTRKLGDAARRALREHAPDFATFARAIGLPGAERLPREPAAVASLARSCDESPDEARRLHPQAFLACAVYRRVDEKLEREPVEDMRLDFEDGYGNRPDAEEDGHAASAAREVAQGLRDGALPPFIGIRIKPLNEDLRRRSLRTLELFVTALAEATGGRLPPHFAVTLPKITSPEQVEALVDALERLESRLRLPAGSIAVELMVETTQSILDRTGSIALPAQVAAARGRCRGAHFGTYDYTAGVGITAAHQLPSHPACDFARHVMQVSLAGTGIWLSDGATTLMPVGPHRGDPLTPEQESENRAAVHRAWKRHHDDVRSSLVHAFYQGWDLHPAQLPTRYAAVFAFFLESREEAGLRLRSFVDKAAQATLVGSIFDDAATGQGLLNYFLRGLNCGALTEAEALETGLTLDELRGRSFVKMLEARRAASAAS